MIPVTVVPERGRLLRPGAYSEVIWGIITSFAPVEGLDGEFDDELIGSERGALGRPSGYGRSSALRALAKGSISTRGSTGESTNPRCR